MVGFLTRVLSCSSGHGSAVLIRKILHIEYVVNRCWRASLPLAMESRQSLQAAQNGARY